MDSRTDWRFEQNISFQDLEKNLRDFFSLHLLTSSSQNLTVLDDFGWQIWQAGLLLTRDEKFKLELWNQDEICLASCQAPVDSRFWWQLPQGALADRLKELIALRAFVPKYSCQLTTDQLAVLNKDEKTVVRLSFYTVTGKDQQVSRLATISSLRGYKKEYAQVVEALAVVQPHAVAPLNLQNILLQSGMQPEILESKTCFNLAPAEPAEAAVSRMAVNMIQLARKQERGMIDDVDTEFVHQYRVNIRKTRSLISLFKKSFTPERYQLFKTELKALGRQSNELRDLDVFLLDQAAYRDMLPENLWPGLTRIFRRVKQRRATAFKGVVNALASEAYQKQINQLLETLQQPPELVAKQSGLEIKTLVSKKILAMYQRIYTDGIAVGPDTPAEAVHALRIECKKLRYLLELFAELFPVKKVKQLVKSLKVLQDNLGRFNDFSVQREFLLQLGQGKNISTEQLASINGLAAVLFNKQIHERNLIVKNIATFIDSAIVDQFKCLFKADFKKGSNA